MKKNYRKRKGFTLIEMTIVLFIISLLVLIIIPNMTKSRENANAVHKNAMISVVQSQLDDYLDDHPENDEPGRGVSLSKLQTSGYLSNDQVKKASAEKIDIDNSKAPVVTKDGKPINKSDQNSSQS